MNLIYLLIGFSLFLLSIIITFYYSFLFPKKIQIIDNIRLPIQSKIMKNLSSFLIDGYHINIFRDMPQSPNAISYSELIPYLNNLKTGDIFFTNSEKYLSSKLIYGKWKHSAIFIGSKKEMSKHFITNPKLYKIFIKYYNNEEDILILDSSKDGVSIRKFNDLSNLKKNSLLISLIAFRINKKKEDINTFLNYAIKQIGKPYDYDLSDKNSESFYCSELIFKSLKEVSIDCTIKEKKFFTREIIYPNNIVEYIIKKELDNKDFKFIFFLEKKNKKIEKLKIENYSF